MLNLFHSDTQLDAAARRGNFMRIQGIDAELLDRRRVREMAPFLDYDNARFPIHGGLLQPRGGTVRHDAVAWGYARRADSRGVDIIQNCEVTGIRIENGKVRGVETTKGFIACKKLGLAAAGNSSEVARMAGIRLPIESHVLQAFVSEGLKPYLDTVITFGAGHFYVSQSDKGGLVFGGDLDGYNSYARRGNLPMVEHVIEAGVAMIPGLSRVKALRAGVGIMDMSMDGSPPAPILEEFDIADADRAAVNELIERVTATLDGADRSRRGVILAALAELSARYMQSAADAKTSGPSKAVS